MSTENSRRNSKLFMKHIGVALTWAALLIAVIGIFAAVENAFPDGDFVEYWAAAKLFLSHSDPYSPTQVLKMEQSAGYAQTRPLMFLSPPWILPIIAPLGLIPFTLSLTIWRILCIGALFVSADLLWRHYNEDSQHFWLPWLLTLLFVPNLLCIQMCQTAPFILAGTTAFLRYTEKNRPWPAGFALFALGVKPHLLYIVAVAIILVILKQKLWKTLAAGAIIYGITIIAVLFINPAALVGYFTNVPAQSMAHISSIGGFLRIHFGADRHWLQFLPVILGLVWFSFHWAKFKSSWRWKEQLPLLVCVSLASAPYGWTFDLPLLMIPIVQSAALLLSASSLFRVVMFISFGLFDLTLFLLNRFAVAEIKLIWAAPICLLLYMAIYSRILRISQLHRTRIFT